MEPIKGGFCFELQGAVGSLPPLVLPGCPRWTCNTCCHGGMDNKSDFRVPKESVAFGARARMVGGGKDVPCFVLACAHKPPRPVLMMALLSRIFLFKANSSAMWVSWCSGLILPYFPDSPRSASMQMLMLILVLVLTLIINLVPILIMMLILMLMVMLILTLMLMVILMLILTSMLTVVLILITVLILNLIPHVATVTRTPLGATPASSFKAGSKDAGARKAAGEGQDTQRSQPVSPGPLLLCSTCPASFHLPCLRPRLRAAPKGKWSCAYCFATGRAKGGDSDGACGAVRLMESLRQGMQGAIRVSDAFNRSSCGWSPNEADRCGFYAPYMGDFPYPLTGVSEKGRN